VSEFQQHAHNDDRIFGGKKYCSVCWQAGVEVGVDEAVQQAGIHAGQLIAFFLKQAVTQNSVEAYS
jgi:hypothetical protein